MGEAVTASDEELLSRMASGDERAFTALYRRRQPAVYRFALRMSGSETAAEEAVQEVFLALIRHRRRFDPCKGPLAAWLFGMARHAVLRHLERERRHLPLENSADPEPAAPDGLAGNQERRWEIEAVRRAVMALPARSREVVVLSELHELSYQETAAALGCAVGTVRSRLHRARELLAAKLRAAGSRKSGDPAGCAV